MGIGPGNGRGLDCYRRKLEVDCMETTINLDDDLLQEASELTGVKEKGRLIHMGLELLVQREAARQLAAMGGTDPKATLRGLKRRLCCSPDAVR